MEHVSVDLGYGYVKAISSTGKRVIFPSVVGKGMDRELGASFSKKTGVDIDNMQLTYEGNDYFVGELANQSSSSSRVFETERFNHLYTHILLNTAIQLVTDGGSDRVRVSTGLPLDFYKSQAKDFQQSILGLQPSIEWKTGLLDGGTRRITIEDALVFPQGASALFSALITSEQKFAFPKFMNRGSLVALIDIGFRTTDYVVVEIQSDSSFIPLVKLSGTEDVGVVNLHRDIRQAYKSKTGGADLNDFHLNRLLEHESLTVRGEKIDFKDVIEESKKSIVTNIVDKINNKWGTESDLFEAIFLAGGGGDLFESFIQPSFHNRLIKIQESQFANTIGYLRIGKSAYRMKDEMRIE